jgi:cyclic beta-1,2-glucan synthetase
MLDNLFSQCKEFSELDFTFLYDPSPNLFSIGFNVTDHRLDNSYYDLLASEARLSSFLSIAMRQVDKSHWFALSRLITYSHGAPALISWSGSMFEYLMPALLMPTYEKTILYQTYQSVVKRHIAYGNQKGIPWGFSESGYNATDIHLNYQYRAFGVPGLGLKRGLVEDLVVAPYATMLALMVAPEEAYKNLRNLSHLGYEGVYGFYEAIDYTPPRLPQGESFSIVRSYMAHHQGMSLIAIGASLMNRPMERRFMSNLLHKVVDLLLQERIPKDISPIYPHQLETERERTTQELLENVLCYRTPNTDIPEVHLLSNGRYHVVISNAGGGYSRWKDLMLTRWREDATRDSCGTFCYIRDVESGHYWSTSYQPTLNKGDHYEAIFSQARAEFRRQDYDIDTHTNISVSPEDDLELRRITLTNRSQKTRALEITSYAEIALSLAPHEVAHPAFNNLFIQTEVLNSCQALLCTKRPRSALEAQPWMFHLVLVQGDELGDVFYETDRSQFIGRGRTSIAPAAIQTPLTGSEGSVLDPVLSIRRSIVLAPDESLTIDMIFGIADSREAAVALADKYHDRRMADRVFELAWTHSQVMLRHLNASESDSRLFERLASSLIYASHLRRADAQVLIKNRRGQNSLWTYGISGDLPITLLRVTNSNSLDLVRQVVQAHAFWKMKGLNCDLVILNEDDSVYRQSLYDQVMGIVATGTEPQMIDKPGGIFVRRFEQVSDEDRALLQTVSRLVLSDKHGNLLEQLDRPGRPEPILPILKPTHSSLLESSTEEIDLPKRAFNNGLGGFASDGREYQILLYSNQMTPAPWINVLANPEFGTIVSESGGSYTWAENAHEFRLSPWYNDPVTDQSGEGIYIRDDDSARFWSPSPLPSRGSTPYLIRHGFGYTIFEHLEEGIHSEFSIYVAADAPVKFAVVKLKNQSHRTRKITVSGLWELVLGQTRSKNAIHVVTEIDHSTGAFLAKNPYNTDFPERVVFVDSTGGSRSWTGDRKEYLGRNGTPMNPAAMQYVKLSGRVGAGYDPCCGVHVRLEIPAGEEREVIFRLGYGRNLSLARDFIRKFREIKSNQEVLEKVKKRWDLTLGAVQVETPDPSLNFMANGWLLYQTLSSRMWARTGYYQSSGAFGFRDQLQDSMALMYAEPQLARAHILTATAHQFREGDVQHWWHPPTNRGVRTHFSDDFLWLPYVTCHYVSTSGDDTVLDEILPFLESRPVRPDEESFYDVHPRAQESGTVYDHCVRALKNALKFGSHGLPLIGGGDWNDGMNLVGVHGRGESVWMAFFLYETLMRFADLARQRKDSLFSDACLEHAARLQKNIEQHAWDGEWYLRAFFDDGSPLGSSRNPECQIDSLPQSWAILSRAANTERARKSLESADRRLVRRQDGLIQLLDPPFNSSELNPGYIKGYVPGVRENGGQYTHAAIWLIMAFARMGNVEKAWELFNLINPVRHGSTAYTCERYKVEPYVVAADIYTVPPNTGRGGWTWYTGSAAWMYRLILESLLGLKLEGNRLSFHPCVPPQWKFFRIHYRYGDSLYHIQVSNASQNWSNSAHLSIDGVPLEGEVILLNKDGKEHSVEIQY